MKFKEPFVESIAQIVRDVLVELRMYSNEAFALVMRTGAAETRYRHLEQVGGGPALGFWQVELDTADDTWHNYAVFRTDLRDRLKRITGIEKGPWTRFQILSNIALQVVLCRLKYKRDPNPIPAGLEEQAAYWLSVYNAGGKGSMDHFIEAAKKMEA